MMYRKLLENVGRLEARIGSTEPIYFASIERLGEVREDLTKLDADRHLLGVIKPFLIECGTMARVVGQQGLDWTGYGQSIRDMEPHFAKLREKRFITTDFNEEAVSNAVKTVHSGLKRFPKLGGPTVVSKVLHLLNPEIFVMWDGNIRRVYHAKNRHVNEFPEGHLEFVKEAQKELKEAVTDHQRETGNSLDQVEQEIGGRFKNKTLARIIDEYNYSTYTLT
jgi:hypothetical protein